MMGQESFPLWEPEEETTKSEYRGQSMFIGIPTLGYYYLQTIFFFFFPFKKIIINSSISCQLVRFFYVLGALLFVGSLIPEGNRHFSDPRGHTRLSWWVRKIWLLSWFQNPLFSCLIFSPRSIRELSISWVGSKFVPHVKFGNKKKDQFVDAYNVLESTTTFVFYFLKFK